MANLTLAIPDDLKRELDSMPEINWSEVARSAIRERAVQYKKLHEYQAIARANLTDKDIKELADKINQAVYNKYRKMHPEYFPSSSTRTSSSRRSSVKPSRTS
jgi:hypothetical protein